MERLLVLKHHLTAAETEVDTPYTLVITLNRPKVLNAQNLKLITEVLEAVTKAGSRTVVLQGAGSSFSAGGDVIALRRSPKDCPEILRNEYTLPYRVYSRLGYSVALMKGTTMGAGAGLALACRARVATNSTVWAFPETGMGLLPDVGANFILPKLKSKAVGLYLALTGQRLNGTDCYYLGIATHYVEDSVLPQLVHALASSGNPVEILNNFHQMPDPGQRTLPKFLPEIEETFSSVTSIEELFTRLKTKGSDWAKRTLATLVFMCPLSLKLELHMFTLCQTLSYGEVMDREYDVNTMLSAKRTENFHIGVDTRLVRKEKGRPHWVPASVGEVTESMVLACLQNEAGPGLNTSKIRE